MRARCRWPPPRTAELHIQDLHLGAKRQPRWRSTTAGGGTDWTSANVDTLLTNGTLTGGYIGFDTTNAASGATYATSITGSPGFGLTKLGSNTLTLSGADTYGGNTTVNAGTLAFGADNVIPGGVGKGNVAVNAGATLDLASYNATINGLNDGTGGGGTVDNTVAGTPLLTLGGNSAASAFSGTIQSTAGTLSLSKIGTGTVTLSGPNSYTGLTTVNGGTLELGAAAQDPVLTLGGADIMAGKLVFDYTGGSLSSPLSTVQGAVTSLRSMNRLGNSAAGLHRRLGEQSDSRLHVARRRQPGRHRRRHGPEHRAVEL